MAARSATRKTPASVWCVFAFLLAHAAILAGAVRSTPKAAYSSLTSAVNPVQYHLDYIKAFGYPAEFHQATTEDGFVLGLFRIPGGRGSTSTNRKVAVVQHGLLGSSFGWVVNLPDQALAYMLADAGYDVWLPNSRGNTFSRNNTHYDPSQTEFWDFSWDDQVKYDLPAVYDYVLRTTGGDDLVYVGHSQGTTMMFGALTTPSVAEYLLPRTSHYMALAPVAYVGNIEQQLLKDLAAMDLGQMLLKFGMKEWVPDEWIMHYIDPTLCAIAPVFCNNLLVALAGCTLEHKNVTAVANYLRIEPAGTSVKNIVHWSQDIRTNAFEMFDYESPASNMKHYNQSEPPKYDLSKIQLPNETLFFTGGFDTLADPTDVNHLMLLMDEATKNDRSKTPVVYKTLSYDHLDFTLAIDANTNVYDVIIQHISE